MEDFNLEGSEFIELKNLLKVTNLVASGGDAKAVIDAGEVKVDGLVETRKACKIREGQVISFQNQSVRVVK